MFCYHEYEQRKTYLINETTRFIIIHIIEIQIFIIKFENTKMGNKSINDVVYLFNERKSIKLFIKTNSTISQ